MYSNLECGTLHCQGGRDRPDTMFRNVNYHAAHSQTGADGNKYQCKMANGVTDPETNEDWSMVADGTICGPPNSHKASIFFKIVFTYYNKYYISIFISLTKVVNAPFSNKVFLN